MPMEVVGDVAGAGGCELVQEGLGRLRCRHRHGRSEQRAEGEEGEGGLKGDRVGEGAHDHGGDHAGQLSTEDDHA
ncbi:hypothetical protein ACGFZB_32975 [Streptomyces cinerochromogenes]|uniref:Uncharacterized protein n=1 Tax=Streptomyces cinerochromogenes TaxID=66422 RepID=A0ABW7BD88_9ACTN